MGKTHFIIIQKRFAVTQNLLQLIFTKYERQVKKGRVSLLRHSSMKYLKLNQRIMYIKANADKSMHYLQRFEIKILNNSYQVIL